MLHSRKNKISVFEDTLLNKASEQFDVQAELTRIGGFLLRKKSLGISTSIWSLAQVMVSLISV